MAALVHGPSDMTSYLPTSELAIFLKSPLVQPLTLASGEESTSLGRSAQPSVSLVETKCIGNCCELPEKIEAAEGASERRTLHRFNSI